jgi:hypothetical protein
MSNELKYLPSLGMSGFYTLASPYSNLISSTTKYTCSGVVSINGEIASGTDVLNSVYIVNGDTEANYNNDLKNGVSLITITSGTGDVVTFPNSALLSVPLANGVIYRNTVLGISLSAVPDSLDLSVLQNDISNLVYDSLGVRSTTFATTVGSATILTEAQDAKVTAARSAAINDNSNLLYQNRLLLQQNQALQTQLDSLKAYVAATL